MSLKRERREDKLVVTKRRSGRGDEGKCGKKRKFNGGGFENNKSKKK